MKILKTQKGITLIALIITIIVLLILAAVAIGAVRDSGIIGYAQNSADKYNTGKSEEESKLKGFEDAISEYENGESFGTSGEGSGDIIIPPDEEETDPTEGVPIPAGFYYVTGTKDTGLVISDDKADENNANGKSGNQFVWVPVTTDISTEEYVYSTISYGNNYGKIFREPDINNSDKNQKLEKAQCEDMDKDGTLETEDFKEQLKKEYKLMAESVNKYDGFYVGRYETSKNEANPESKYRKSPYRMMTMEEDWYAMYVLGKSYKTNSVQGSMMWGIQYDKMIEWMGQEANMSISNYTYPGSQGGTNLYDVIKNVHEIYGGLRELTMEKAGETYEDSRTVRGDGAQPPSVRNAKDMYTSDLNMGFRLAIYIK